MATDISLPSSNLLHDIHRSLDAMHQIDLIYLEHGHHGNLMYDGFLIALKMIRNYGIKVSFLVYIKNFLASKKGIIKCLEDTAAFLRKAKITVSQSYDAIVFEREATKQYKDQAERKTRQVFDLENRILTLKTDLSEKDRDISKLRGEMEQIAEVKLDMKRDLQFAEERVGIHTATIDMQRHELERNMKTCQELASKLKIEREAKVEMSQENSRLQEENDNFILKVKQLNEQLERYKERHGNESHTDLERDENEGAKGKTSRYPRHVKEKRNVRFKRDSNGELVNKLKARDLKIKALEAELEVKTLENEYISMKMREYERRLSSFNDEMKGQFGLVRKYRDSLQDKDRLIHELHDRSIRYMETVHDQRKELSKLQKRLTDVNRKSKHDTTNMEREMSQLQIHITKLEQDLSTQQKKYERHINHLNKQVATYTNEAKHHRKELESLAKEMDEVKSSPVEQFLIQPFDSKPQLPTANAHMKANASSKENNKAFIDLNDRLKQGNHYQRTSKTQHKRTSRQQEQRQRKDEKQSDAKLAQTDTDLKHLMTFGSGGRKASDIGDQHTSAPTNKSGSFWVLSEEANELRRLLKEKEHVIHEKNKTIEKLQRHTNQDTRQALVAELAEKLSVNDGQLNVISTLINEKAELVDRLAAEMNHKLSANETDLENVSIKARPVNVAEEYSLLMSNSWLDAKSVLDDEIKGIVTEAWKTEFLCNILMVAEEQAMKAYITLTERLAFIISAPFSDYNTPDHRWEDSQETMTGELPQEITIVISDYLRRNSDEINIDHLVQNAEVTIKDIHYAKKGAARFMQLTNVRSYLYETVRLAWKMVIQRPPMRFDISQHDQLWNQADQNTLELTLDSKPTHPDAIIKYFKHPRLMHGKRTMVKGVVFVS